MKNVIWLKPEFLGVRRIPWKRNLSISNRFICGNCVISIPIPEHWHKHESTNLISLIKGEAKITICSLVVYFSIILRFKNKWCIVLNVIKCSFESLIIKFIWFFFQDIFRQTKHTLQDGETSQEFCSFRLHSQKDLYLSVTPDRQLAVQRSDTVPDPQLPDDRCFVLHPVSNGSVFIQPYHHKGRRELSLSTSQWTEHPIHLS